MNDDRLLADEAADQWRLVQGDLDPDETILLTVRSGSMVPVMPVSARIEVATADGNRCRVGDVVVFRQGERLIAHRLLFGWGHAPAGWFLQRGDGVSPAGCLRSDSILGRVTAVHHTDGTVVRLDDPGHGWRALRAARRSLRRLVRDVLAAPARKVRQWLTREHSGSA